MDQVNQAVQERETVWDIIKGTVVCLALVFYYWIVAIVKSILPASIQGKDVSGETVLITGAGMQIIMYFTIIKSRPHSSLFVGAKCLNIRIICSIMLSVVALGMAFFR